MKYFKVSVIVILFIGLFICLVDNIYYKKEITKLQSQVQFCHSLDTLEEHFLQIRTQIDGTYLNKNILSEIKSLNKSDLILVFFFGNNNCSFCIEQGTKILKDNIKEIGYQNIIILSGYNNTRTLNVICSNYGIDPISKLNIPKGELNLSIERISRPSFFLLDKKGKISNTFIVEKELPLRTKKYIECITKNNAFKEYKL